jgi:hypothetical protein
MKIDPRLGKAVEAAASSFGFTLAGVLAGFFTLAASTQVTYHSVTASGISSPGHLWTFTQATWFAFLIANLVTPALRGLAAASHHTSA